MPRISAFYGIVITMYFRDHPPPHFHARYGDHVAEVAIDTLAVIDGWLPPRALRLTLEWAGEHQASSAPTGPEPARTRRWLGSIHCPSI